MKAVYTNGQWEIHLPSLGWICVGSKLSNVYKELAARGYEF